MKKKKNVWQHFHSGKSASMQYNGKLWKLVSVFNVKEQENHHKCRDYTKVYVYKCVMLSRCRSGKGLGCVMW